MGAVYQGNLHKRASLDMVRMEKLGAHSFWSDGRIGWAWLVCLLQMPEVAHSAGWLLAIPAESGEGEHAP